MNLITEPMHIHSLNGALAEATIVDKVGDNKYIAEYNGVRCTAIYNPVSYTHLLIWKFRMEVL